MTHRLYCLDWHNNKTVAIITSVGLEKFSSGDKLVYQLPGERGGQSIATYLGLEDTKKSLMRTGEYLDHLAPDDKKYFDTMQQQAQKKYPLFKKKFKHHFPDAIPVTARYHIFAEQYYFYFYSEERFNFVEFIKEFREDLKAQFFLFQVGARDMIKMSPATDDIVGCNGINLCCKSNRPLPSIDVEMLVAQHLE